MGRPLREREKSRTPSKFSRVNLLVCESIATTSVCWYLVVSTLTIQKQYLSPYFHNTKYNIFEAIWKIEGTTGPPGDGEAGKEITQSLNSLLS